MRSLPTTLSVLSAACVAIAALAPANSAANPANDAPAASVRVEPLAGRETFLAGAQAAAVEPSSSEPPATTVEKRLALFVAGAMPALARAAETERMARPPQAPAAAELDLVGISGLLLVLWGMAAALGLYYGAISFASLPGVRPRTLQHVAASPQ